MIIDIISDLHGAKPELKGGDLLIIAGDLTENDQPPSWAKFFEYLIDLTVKYTEIIIIAGNHDNALEHGLRINNFCPNVFYLCDSGTEFEGLKIWGTPWTAWFDGINPRCSAFTLKTDKELAEKWALIPEDTDILITHSPPFGILDEAMHTHNYQSVGSKSLLARVHKIRPRIHCFGHIHEAYGQYKADGVHFINASIMDVNYKPSNKPTRIEL